MKTSPLFKIAFAVAFVFTSTIYSNAQWSITSPGGNSAVYNNNDITTSTNIIGKNLILNGNTLKIGGVRSTIIVQGDNGSQVGGLQMVSPDNGTTFIMTPTDASNAVKGTSTISMGGFGLFNTSTVNMILSGTLGVGMTCVPSDARMAVGGKLYATAIKVELTNTSGCFPDYVFEKDYKLMSLSEVERYIQKNKHLPEVPSAAEVEEKGIDVASMDVILLKKIEELTLYMLEMKKENDLLKQDRDMTDKKLQILSDQFQTLIKQSAAK